MDIKELEAQFKRIDERSDVDSVDARLEGDSESSGSINIVVYEKGKSLPQGGEEAPPPGGEWESAPIQMVNLLDLDLGQVDIPDSYIDDMIRGAIANQDNIPGLPGVKIKQIGASRDYELVEDYTYKTTLGGASEFSITALTGFVYDRSSIPRIFWVIIDKDDLSNVPPLFHDLLYKHGGALPQNQVTPYRTFQREETDKLFLELMKKSGVKRWRYKLAYEAVRKFAKPFWNG